MKRLLFLFLITASFEACHKDDSSITGWNILSCGEIISSLNSVFFTDKNTGYATGYNEGFASETGYSAIGFILKTTDGGNTWSSKRTNNESIDWLENVCFSNTNSGFILGYRPETGAILLKTIDCGSTWDPITLDTARLLRLTSAYFTDSNTGYLTGYKNSVNGSEVYGTILKTTDGGNSWSALNVTNPKGSFLNSICFPEANTGYIAGQNFTSGSIYNGVFLKTTDAGATWSNLSTTIQCAYKSIFFTDKSTGFGVGETIIGTGESTLIKTTDGGISWNEVTLQDKHITLNSICFADANTGYAVGAKEYSSSGHINFCAAILKTTDGGTSWKLTVLKNAGPLNSIQIFDKETVYAVGKNGTIIKETTNL